MTDSNTGTDDKLLAEIRAFRDNAQDYWRDNYDQGRRDKEFVTVEGAQWDAKAVEERKSKDQAVLEFNLVRTYCRQQINTQRQNRPQAQVLPVDSNADMEIAKVLSGLIKDTEESSDFEGAVDAAAENAVYGGLGFIRIGADYVDSRSFQQEPMYIAVHNSEAVLIDPLSRSLDGSDMNRCIVAEWVDKEAAEKEHGDGAVADFEWDNQSQWHNDTDKTVCIVEYFYKDEVPATLYLLADGSTAYDDELDAEQKKSVVKERKTTKTVIKWAKASGCKILEKGEFPGKYIPIVPVYGEVTWIENKRHVFSLVHFAKDAQRLFNYWKSAEATILSKNQEDILVADGESIADYTEEWRNPDKHKILRVTSVNANGQQLQMPTRISPTGAPIGIMNAAMGAQQLVTDIFNMHAPIMGAQGNETSGIAIQKRQQQSETAQFHFQDNVNKSTRQCAKILLGLYPAYYDVPIVRRIIGSDGETSMVKLNTPPDPENQSELSKAIDGVLNNLSIGRYDVRMDTGPSYNTQRDQNFQAMMQLMQFNPELFGIIGDILIKDSPLLNAKEIADRVKQTIPENIRNAGKEQGGLPPEVQAQIQQLDQVIQQMSQALQQAQAELQDKSADREKDIIVAQINAANRTDVQELKGTTEIIKQYMAQMGSIQDALQQLPQQWLQSGDSMNSYQPNQPQPNQEFTPQSELEPPDSAQIPIEDPATEQGFFMGNDPSLDQAQNFAPESDQFGDTAQPMINEDFQP